MKKFIGRLAVGLSDSLKPIILWAAGLKRDPKREGWFIVGGFSVHREFAIERAEKILLRN